MDAATIWPAVFGNAHPVEIEIGCGTGAFLLQIAAQNPERNFFAIEHATARAAAVERLLNANGTSNARIIAADAACVLRELVPKASVAAFHIYFPDPWWKRRHHRRRLFNERFAKDLAGALVSGGYVHTATDVEEVLSLIRNAMNASHAFLEDDVVQPPRRCLTTFERKGLARGATIWKRSFRKR